MCLFCCDMLCWFSFITCCGCRDMVTRRLVFFPPDPYYNLLGNDENEKDFYQRLQSEQNGTDDIKEEHNATTTSNDSDAVVLEVGTKPSSHHKSKLSINNNKVMTQTEMEALNSSDDMTTSDDTKNLNKPSTNTKSSNHHHPQNIVNPKIYGTFRIRDDDENLASFYKTNYDLDIKNFKSQYLTTSRGSKIASYYIRHPRTDYTILFSHGNAADIGLMRNHLCRMYQKCKVSIFAYEYSGYGRSSGKPSEKNTYCDIETAYKYLTKKLKIPPSHIIVYGQSLGTCVSVYLASKYSVGGVILHSPLMSGLRVMQHFDKTYWFDIYPVVEQIQQVFAPVWVIHGNRDKEIDVIHGKILSRIAPNSYQPWFVPYAGHNDIEVMFPDALFNKIRKFLKFLKNEEEAHKYHGTELDEEEEDEDGMYGRPEEEEEDDDDEDDTLQRRINAQYLTKSVTQKNPDQSISPPPPQSIMTKSHESVLTKNRQITLPSRKFSNTGHSMMADEDDESILKTPSIAASLSVKDSNLISMSIKADEKSTNKNYDTVLTPTMRTIHSKEQSTSEMLTLDHKQTMDDQSQTMSTVNVRLSKARKSRKKLHPGIDEMDVEEHKGDDILHSKSNIHINIHKRRMNKRKRKRKKLQYKPLNLPTSTNMTTNIDQCIKRRDNLPMDDDESSASSSSSEDEGIGNNDDHQQDEDDDDDDEDANLNVGVDINGDSSSLEIESPNNHETADNVHLNAKDK